MGDLSAHFSRHELACHHCGRLELAAGFLEQLERTRVAIGRPLRPVSGYRCPAHNRAVGGAPDSRHLHGDAVDFPTGYITKEQAHDLGWRGIGYAGRWCVHADMRPGAGAIFPDP